uniref:Uncharacterized protein n=3 Tax=Aegilops tauschii subsp. strangulata TaxID=200361 RepID=A0A453R6D0_AEGTS
FLPNKPSNVIQISPLQLQSVDTSSIETSAKKSYQHRKAQEDKQWDHYLADTGHATPQITAPEENHGSRRGAQGGEAVRRVGERPRRHGPERAGAQGRALRVRGRGPGAQERGAAAPGPRPRRQGPRARRRRPRPRRVARHPRVRRRGVARPCVAAAPAAGPAPRARRGQVLGEVLPRRGVAALAPCLVRGGRGGAGGAGEGDERADGGDGGGNPEGVPARRRRRGREPGLLDVVLGSCAAGTRVLSSVAGEEIVEAGALPRVHASLVAFDELAAAFGTSVPHERNERRATRPRELFMPA